MYTGGSHVRCSYLPTSVAQSCVIKNTLAHTDLSKGAHSVCLAMRADDVPRTGGGGFGRSSPAAGWAPRPHQLLQM